MRCGGFQRQRHVLQRRIAPASALHGPCDIRGGAAMCPNCQAPVRSDADFCTNCGAQLRPASPGAGHAPITQPAGGPPPPVQPMGGPPPPVQPMGGHLPPGQAMGGPPPPGQPAPRWPNQPQQRSGPSFSLDLKRLATTDLTIGGASIVLFISFFLPWFGVLGYSTSGISLHGYLVIALLVDLAVLGYLVLRAGWDTPPFKLPIAHAPLLLIGTGVQLLLVLIGFLQSDGLGHEFGAYLGLLAALVACGAIAVPAISSLQGGSHPGAR